MLLEKLDPNWDFAKRHGQANKIGKAKQGEGWTVCGCCHNIIEKEQIPICQNTKQLQFLGFGVPLFYSFLRSSITLLILSCVVYHIISLYWAITENFEFCQEFENSHYHSRLLAGSEKAQPQCWTFMVRFARLKPAVAQTQEQIVRIASWVVQLLFLLYTRNKLMKKGQYYDQRSTTLSDYSIIIKNLRPQKQIKKKLQKLFQTFFQQSYEIKQITLISDYPEIKNLQKENESVKKKLRQYYKSQVFDENFDELIETYNKKNEEIRIKADEQSQLGLKDEMLCEKVIVIMNTEHIKHEVLQKFPKLKKQKRKQLFQIFGEDCQKIYMQEAPEPIEIVWDHINEQKRTRIIGTIISWSLSILVLAIVTVAIYFILHAKTQLIIESLLQADGQSHKIDGAIALVYITILLILLFNKLVMSFIFHKLTDIEKLQTGFKFQRSFGIKYCLGLFFTTALMTFIVEGIEAQNYHTYIYGLIDEETLMFFGTFTFIPIFWLVNPFQLFKRFKRKKNFGARHFTQKQANQLMEDSSYEIGKRYAEVVQTVWFTYLYSTLIPIGAFLSVIGLTLFYWVDKVNLLRRSVLKVNLSSKLMLTFLTFLQFSLVMVPTGSLIFDGILRQNIKPLNLIPNIIMISLGFLYTILPKQKIINKVFQQKFNLQAKSYDEVKHSFLVNYHSMHPIMKIVNEEKYREKLKKKGFSMTQVPLESQTELVRAV